MLAFALALDEGADGIELDVRRCGSGELIVMHDADLARTTGSSGLVAQTPWSEVRARELGAGQRVPLLDDALDLAASRSAIVNVEVKSEPGDRIRVARAVAKVLGRRAPEERERIVVSTFSPTVCWLLAREPLLPPVALLLDERARNHWGGLAAARLLGPAGLHPFHTRVTSALVSRAHRRGLWVAPWTVNDRADVQRLAGTGVDALITDDVPQAREALGLPRVRR